MMARMYCPNEHLPMLPVNTRLSTSPFAEGSNNNLVGTFSLNQPCTGVLSHPDINRLSLAATIEARIARTLAVARLQVVSDLQALHKSQQHEQNMNIMNKLIQISSPPRPLLSSSPTQYLQGLELRCSNNLHSHLPSIADARRVTSTKVSAEASGASPPNMEAGTVESSPASKKQKASSGMKYYIDIIGEFDILCGRGGRSNHHPGNKRYRHVVSEMKLVYRNTEAKTTKTDLSRAIVEHVCAYGGRFIKKEERTGRFFVLTKAEARKKTSQALRETKELKWTT